MRLSLQSSNILGVVALDGYVAYLTSAGIDIFDDSTWVRKAYVTAVDIVCVAAYSGGLLYGNASGVFKIAYVDIAYGGNVQPDAVSVTTTAPVAMAAHGVRLIICSATGITYMPDLAQPNMKYTCSLTGITLCDINLHGFVVVASGRVLFFFNQSANFTVKSSFSYTVTVPKIGPEKQIPAGIRPSSYTGTYWISDSSGLLDVRVSSSPYDYVYRYDDVTEEFSQLTLSPARSAASQQVAVFGDYVLYTGYNVPMELYKATDPDLTRTFSGLTYTQYKQAIAVDATGTYIFVMMDGAYKLVKRTGDTLSEVQSAVSAPYGGATPIQGSGYWCETDPDYCIALQWTSGNVKIVTLYKRSGDSLVRQSDLVSPNVLSGVQPDVTSGVWIGQYFVFREHAYNKGVYVYELVNGQLLLRHSGDYLTIKSGVDAELSFAKKFGNKYLLKVTTSDNADNKGTRIAHSIVVDPTDSSKVFLQREMNPAYVSMADDITNSSAIADRRGKYYFNSKYGFYYNPVVSEESFGADFTTVNCVRLLDDCLILGTESGVRLYPAPVECLDGTYGLNRGPVFYDLYSVSRDIAGFSDVRFIFAGPEVSRNSGSLMFSALSGTGYKVSFLDMSTLG